MDDEHEHEDLRPWFQRLAELGVKLDVEPWNEETRLVTVFLA